MIKFASISVLLFAVCLAPGAKGQSALTQPTVISSSGGVLDITLTMDYGDVAVHTTTFTNTRLLGGTYPGPTLKIQPGDQVRILFQNNLVEQVGSVKTGDNVYKLPDTSNLHFHGGHVSGELPSDDVRLEVGPQSSYQYDTTFPSNHMPGTHWIHPHLHGSSALQVGGGALMALIVEDTADTMLPSDISGATEVILVIHHIGETRLPQIRNSIGDTTMSITTAATPADFRTVNGQYQPEHTMMTNEWQRWRIIWGDWEGNKLDLQVSGCELKLLAKDGIYILDYPRDITKATIPTGGRADIMVRCTTAGTYQVTDFDGHTIMTIVVTDGGVTATALQTFSPTYPDYLTDLTGTAADSGCSCTTTMDGCPSSGAFCINDYLFDSSLYLHTIAFGSVVERDIGGLNKHPYHHHVYPMQLVGDGLNMISDSDQSTYFQTGDWHDVLAMSLMPQATTVKVRFKADVHTGTMMMHCHILRHEDQGTMSQELILDGGSCACNALVASPSPTAAPSAAPGTSSPTAAPTSSCSCFSADTTVEVEDKGLVAMKDLQVNDMVYVGSKGHTRQYQAVYAFGHFNEYFPSEYYRIFTNSNHSGPIELSATHLLHVDGKVGPVRADTIKPGDKLIHAKVDSPVEDQVVVTMVNRVIRNGAYMPLTKDGTIVVNGIKASTYVSIRDDAPEIVEIFTSIFGLSEQWLLHSWLAPYRLVCTGISSGLCQNDYNEEGIAKWLVFGRYIAITGGRFSRGYQLTGLLLVFGLLLVCIALETVMANPWWGLVVALPLFLVLFVPAKSKGGKMKMI